MTNRLEVVDGWGDAMKVDGRISKRQRQRRERAQLAAWQLRQERIDAIKADMLAMLDERIGLTKPSLLRKLFG